MSPQELQVQQKRELEKKQESTVPARFFVPTTDIFETEEALSLVVEMPGVDKSKVDVSVQDGVRSTMQASRCRRRTPPTSRSRISSG
jgi:HSP20 family protein